MEMRVFCQTDIGLRRKHNEDAVKVYENKNCKMMVVADGMGGHEAGDIASKIVLSVLDEKFNEKTQFQTTHQVKTFVTESLDVMNKKILDYIASHHIMHGMGTTVVLAVITEFCIGVAHVGDSRAYIHSNDELLQITRDHTFVRRLVEEGKLTEEEAKRHPHRHVIMNALGVNQVLKFDFVLIEKYELNSLLLCTDGLCSLVEDYEILNALLSSDKTEEKIRQLIKKANDKGGNDNISVALLECVEGSCA